MAAASLHDVLIRRRDAIVARWEQAVRASSGLDQLHHQERIDSLQQFLDDITAALSRARTDPQQALCLHEGTQTAASHGAQRLHLGLSVLDLVWEYDHLRQAVFAVVAEEAASISVEELRIFAHCLDAGIAAAVAEYVRRRDEQLERKTAEHLGFLSHDLRNALSSTTLSLNSLRNVCDAQALPRLERVERGLRRSLDLIDNTLVEVHLRAGAGLEVTETEVGALVQEVVDDLVEEARFKNVSIEVEGLEGGRAPVDPKLLRSAITNLLGNAIKFTRSDGTIHVRIRRNPGELAIDVEDECGGLPAGDVERLFDPFVGADRSRRGFGLGLAIVKQVASAHGGSPRVVDLPGKGCIFTIEIPIGKNQPPSPDR
jgi:signal transduction histidine kinase